MFLKPLSLLGCVAFVLIAKAVPKSSWDSTLSVDGAYPPSAVANFWLGYYWTFNLLPLKKLDKRLARFQHGYIRPHLRLASSYKVNQAEARLDLYPSSFVGITGGVVFSHSNLSTLSEFSDYNGFSCSSVQCDGWYYKPFVEGKFKFALSESFFGILFARYDFPRAESQTASLMYDPTSSTVFEANYDRSFNYWILGGVFVGERATLSFRYSLLEWDSGMFKNEYSLIFNQGLGKSWNLGLYGRYSDRSDLFEQWAGGLRISWIIKESPAAEERI